MGVEPWVNRGTSTYFLKCMGCPVLSPLYFLRRHFFFVMHSTTYITIFVCLLQLTYFTWIQYNCCHQMLDFRLKFWPNPISVGALPRPHWKSLYSAPQTPYLHVNGPIFKGREGIGRKERDGEERREMGKTHFGSNPVPNPTFCGSVPQLSLPMWKCYTTYFRSTSVYKWTLATKTDK